MRDDDVYHDEQASRRRGSAVVVGIVSIHRADHSQTAKSTSDDTSTVLSEWIGAWNSRSTASLQPHERRVKKARWRRALAGMVQPLKPNQNPYDDPGR
jgi:hypothetical protein